MQSWAADVTYPFFSVASQAACSAEGQARKGVAVYGELDLATGLSYGTQR